MDPRFRPLSELPINIIGVGYLGPDGLFAQNTHAQQDMAETAFDVRPLLRDRKSFKFMAKQDQMAVYASLKAIENSGLEVSDLGDNTGLYFTVGTIPFEQKHLDLLYDKSVESGPGLNVSDKPEHTFSMQRFSTDALNSLNPLLTFKCLPNMPVFHVSYNLGITGSYYVTYPGAGQWLQTLQRALFDLANDKVEYAVVGAVADQRNPLVRHHVQRSYSASRDGLIDSACVLVLSKHRDADALAQLDQFDIDYSPQNTLCQAPDLSKEKRAFDFVAGPVDPSLWIAEHLVKSTEGRKKKPQYMQFSTLDGIRAELRLNL